MMCRIRLSAKGSLPYGSRRGSRTESGSSLVVTAAPKLSEWIVQSAAADSCATVHGNAQIEGLPFAPTVSKLGLVAMLIGLMKLNGGQIVAAEGAACAPVVQSPASAVARAILKQ